MSENQIQFKKLHIDAIIPSRGTPMSAGFDLYALEDTVIVGGGGNVLVPTGIAVQLPQETYGRIAMRSGLAVKQHLGVSAGVIDIDYTGGIGVVVFCSKLFDTTAFMESTTDTNIYTDTDDDTVKKGIESRLMPHIYIIKKGEKFAQLIPEKISYADSQIVDKFNRTYSQHLGYGSTGNGLVVDKSNNF